MGYRDSRYIISEIYRSSLYLCCPNVTVTSHRWRMCSTTSNILLSALNLSLFIRYIGNTKPWTYF